MFELFEKYRKLNIYIVDIRRYYLNKIHEKHTFGRKASKYLSLLNFKYSLTQTALQATE
jgi:hypothetical protein